MKGQPAAPSVWPPGYLSLRPLHYTDRQTSRQLCATDELLSEVCIIRLQTQHMIMFYYVAVITKSTSMVCVLCSSDHQDHQTILWNLKMLYLCVRTGISTTTTSHLSLTAACSDYQMLIYSTHTHTGTHRRTKQACYHTHSYLQEPLPPTERKRDGSHHKARRAKCYVLQMKTNAALGGLRAAHTFSK